jgi:hypothetical protein
VNADGRGDRRESGETRERNVERKSWAKALRRPLPMLAVLGVALGACGGDARPGYYGSGYPGGPGYYGSPYYGGYGGGYGRYYGSRGYYGGGHSGRRTETWSQERLRQHWLNQAQRPR